MSFSFSPDPVSFPCLTINHGLLQAWKSSAGMQTFLFQCGNSNISFLMKDRLKLFFWGLTAVYIYIATKYSQLYSPGQFLSSNWEPLVLPYKNSQTFAGYLWTFSVCLMLDPSPAGIFFFCWFCSGKFQSHLHSWPIQSSFKVSFHHRGQEHPSLVTHVFPLDVPFQVSHWLCQFLLRCR